MKVVLSRIVPAIPRLNTTATRYSSFCQNRPEFPGGEALIDSVAMGEAIQVTFRFDLICHHMKRNLLNCAPPDALTLANDGVYGRKIPLRRGWNFGRCPTRPLRQRHPGHIAGTASAPSANRLRERRARRGPFRASRSRDRPALTPIRTPTTMVVSDTHKPA